MLAAIERDIKERFCMDDRRGDLWIAVAYSGNEEEGVKWKEEVQAVYPKNEIVMNPLSAPLASTGVGLAAGASCPAGSPAARSS